MNEILITGGCGFIGSHTVLCLIEKGFDVVVLDNLCNSNPKSLQRVARLSGKRPVFYEGDIRNKALLVNIFKEHQIKSVIHFAALKAVGESTVKPISYYHNNVYGTLELLDSMLEHNVYDFVFSSSATVYGEQSRAPYVETMQIGQPASPYGFSKVMVERVLSDIATAEPQFRGISLRYFNPIGAHPSGEMGEAPSGKPDNLVPFITQVAVGQRRQLSVFGGDYSTADGTCERDYLHVMDLAEGHVSALEWLNNNPRFTGIDSFNLGTGQPTSVLEIISAFERCSGIPIPYEICPRRDGDLPAFWADPKKSQQTLGWTAKLSLEQMMEDSWRWQSNNPFGYE